MSELTPPDPAYTVPMAEITALVQLPAACLHRARRPIAPNALLNCSQTATSGCRQKLAFSGPPRGISHQRVDEIRAEGPSLAFRRNRSGRPIVPTPVVPVLEGHPPGPGPPGTASVLTVEYSTPDFGPRRIELSWSHA